MTGSRFLCALCLESAIRITSTPTTYRAYIRSAAVTLGGVARPLRVHLKNGWFHVTNWGHDRERIVFDVRDRRPFLELVGEMIGRHAAQVYAAPDRRTDSA